MALIPANNINGYKTVDQSVIGKLQDMGYVTVDTGLTSDSLRYTGESYQTVAPGTGVPIYKDGAGGSFILSEDNRVKQIIAKVPSNDGPPMNRDTRLGPTLGGGFTDGPTGGGGSIIGNGGGFGGGGTILPFPGPGGGGGFNGGGSGGGGSTILPFPGPGGGGSNDGGFGGGGIIPPGFPNTPTPPFIPGGGIGSGKIFTKFDGGDIIPNQQDEITRALWCNNVGNVLTFFTSSAQTDTQKRYYYEVYNSASSACGACAMFSVAYGNKQGSGSADEGGQINDTPSRAIYGQYRGLCLNSNQERFIIGGTATDEIYVVNVNRARMREYLDEGNLEINLAHLSGSEFVAGGNALDTHTGSNVTLAGNGKVLRLIDDSIINNATITEAGEVYQMVSGSIEDGVYNSSSPHVYGLMYRRLGIVVLDANRLDLSASFGTVTGSEVAGDNAYKLFTSISGAAQYQDGSGDYLGFQGRSVEKVKSTHFFCRVRNAEYNFSNNPSYTTGSDGDLAQPTFINNPKTYITTIGLYNNNKELVAVAKLSKALQKDFTKEALIKVKLDF